MGSLGRASAHLVSARPGPNRVDPKLVGKELHMARKRRIFDMSLFVCFFLSFFLSLIFFGLPFVYHPSEPPLVEDRKIGCSDEDS